MPKVKVNTSIEERLLLAQAVITNALTDSDLRAAIAAARTAANEFAA